MLTPTRLRAVAATGLVVGSVALVSTGPAHAAGAPTPQVQAAEHWLTGMLGDSSSKNPGLLPSSYGGANYGASADAIISLSEAGDTSDANPIGAALKSTIDNYISGESFGDTGSTYAGSAAKAAVALASVGIDPATVNTQLGGQPAGDLISRLDATVRPSGRIQDVSQYGDYENVLGQSFAANALTAAGSADAAKVTTFLLSQQCSGGWFRQSFTAGSPDTACDADPKSSPSVDATATAVLNLLPQATSDATVARAVGRAESWLVGVEHTDGGWGDASVGGASNANSTGLVVRALHGLGGHAAAVSTGASWLRGTQLADVGSCTPYAAGEVGAIAYDHAAWASTQKEGVSAKLDQFVVAASQALPALDYLPATASAPKLSGPTGFVQAGKSAAYSVTGLAPGASACLSVGSSKSLVASGIAGTAASRLALPAGTANRVVTVIADGGAKATVTTKVLGAKRLSPKLSAATVKVGHTVTVTVSGLAGKEKVTVKLRGVKVTGGTASSTGVYRATFTVRGATGTATVTTTGQFADRTGSVTLKVVKAS